MDSPDLSDLVAGFGQLIRAARARHGRVVVVVVDEYDKPILDKLHDRATALDPPLTEDAPRNMQGDVSSAA